MKLAPRTITGVGAPAFGINTGRSSLQGVRASYLTTATTALNNSTSAYDLNFRRSMEYTLAAVNGLGIAATVNNLVQRAAKTSLKSGFFPLAKALMNLAIGSATAALRQGGLAGLPTGFGALNTADPTLASTSSALSDSLNASGCQQSAQQNVKDFQSAYNNAGGSPALAVDGLYGVNTAGALQTVLNGPVVAGCVGQASSGGGGGGGGSTTPTTAPTDVSQTVAGTDLLPLALAGVAGAGLIGWAIYAKKRGRTRIIRRLAHHRR